MARVPHISRFLRDVGNTQIWIGNFPTGTILVSRKVKSQRLSISHISRQKASRDMGHPNWRHYRLHYALVFGVGHHQGCRLNGFAAKKAGDGQNGNNVG
jgi:hypothetical protein